MDCPVENEILHLFLASFVKKNIFDLEKKIPPNKVNFCSGHPIVSEFISIPTRFSQNLEMTRLTLTTILPASCEYTLLAPPTENPDTMKLK